MAKTTMIVRGQHDHLHINYSQLHTSFNVNNLKSKTYYRENEYNPMTPSLDDAAKLS